jgi:hypothetical protein
MAALINKRLQAAAEAADGRVFYIWIFRPNDFKFMAVNR